MRTESSQTSENKHPKCNRAWHMRFHCSWIVVLEKTTVGATRCPFCPRPGFQKRVWVNLLAQNDQISQIALRRIFALQAPIAPITPFYSIENTCTPGLSKRLLTEGL